MTKIVPSVPQSEGGGNTKTPPVKKQVSPAKKWCFTLNNYTEEDISSIDLQFDKYDKIIVGKEIGQMGTPHLQGYIEFKKKLRPSSLKLNKGIHWEKAKGDLQDNFDYCSKGNDILFERGMPKDIKIITKLYDWQEKVLQLYKSPINDRKIYWFYEPLGNTGKSAFVKYMIVKYRILFLSGGKYSDIMNIIFNSDMDVCDCIMIDIPRANEGHISYASLESIKNGMVCNTKYETGVKIFNSPHLFIFANFAPDNVDNLSHDRWDIINLNEIMDRDF